ncbi:hypothetical protein Scep_015584 [Stephania cephalantha]|uniref:Uncharacterized protein n=1 Tax=Stephania cephalantha TaxID=152367 RepID=A0AAP0J5E2_9MAGN
MYLEARIDHSKDAKSTNATLSPGGARHRAAQRDPGPPLRQSTAGGHPRGAQPGALRRKEGPGPPLRGLRPSQGRGDAKVREVFDRSLKLEAELRSVDSARAELAQVRADASMLRLEREEMAVKLQGVNGEVMRARAEAAIEYEKKIRGDNLEHSLAMQKTMKALAHEIEKLHAELANAEKRARAAAIVATAAVNPVILHLKKGKRGKEDEALKPEQNQLEPLRS